ncbi:ATP-dependent Clp protease ATP-binding subunit [Patescibacteria group bacterium]|nr:ATP-dependent Clp protease ATP-binding subunit [Patescibacteria group bacterium]
MADATKLNFIVCSECKGMGSIDGKACANCQGIGTALYFNDHILYWGQYYDAASINYEKATRKIKIIFNIALALLGLSGIILMAYLGYLDNFKSFFSIKYWLTPSPEKLYFWFTLIVDLYLYYRLEQESSSQYSVMKKIFQKTQASIDLGLDWPSIWKLKKENFIDVSFAFSEQAKKATQSAWELARHFEHPDVLRIHLFGIASQFDKSAIILGRLGINFEQFKQKISRYLSKNIITRSQNPLLSVEIQKTFLLAYVKSYEANGKKVDLPEIMLAIASPEVIGVKKKDDIEEILIDFDLNYQKIINVVAWIRIQAQLREKLERFRLLARYKPKSGLDRAMTAVSTPLLDQFSDDLTLKAKYGHLFPCIDREQEFEQLFRIMEGSRQGVLLVGQQGVGRTAIIEGLAERMVTEEVPELLQDKRLVSLDLSRMLAGADAAMAEERFLQITDEIIRSQNIVLVVENLHAVSGITSGSEGSLDLSEVFAQILSRHLFHCIATTNPAEYSKFIEGKSLGAEFQLIKVEELDLNNAICVLEAKSGPIEYQNKVYFSYDAIEKAAVLSSRYIHDRYLPEKAIEILEQTAIKVSNEKGKNTVVNADDIASVIASMTKIPVAKVTEKESRKLLDLEEKIHERMIGQDEAVNIVAASLRRARAELREGKRPISSLLFLGPTGVGKTELAKTVAEVYFSGENSMFRFDMSEYQDVASIDRLIGRGSQPGLLTEQVRKNPFSLILFDEVEKAEPNILNLFLQMMDDGRLTDSQGRTIDFTNTIIIMTSNAGAQFIQDEINKGTVVDKIKNSLLNEELKKYFRPEFLNRFDGIVVFKPLTMTEVIEIARLMVGKISRRLQEKGIEFHVADEAIAELAELGFDPKFGARPLRRVIQERVDDVLANHLLRGELDRRDKVTLELGGELKIEKAEQI